MIIAGVCCSTSYRTLYIVTKSFQTLTIIFACLGTNTNFLLPQLYLYIYGRNYKMLVMYWLLLGLGLRLGLRVRVEVRVEG